MFQSMLLFNGQGGTLYDASELNPQALSFFSSRARSLRMLGTVRANVEMLWCDPLTNVQPGQIVKSTLTGVYYLVVKCEKDATLAPWTATLTALNVLQFSGQITGYATVPQASTSLNVYGEAPGGLTETAKTIRVIFDLTTSLFEESTAGSLPSGTLTLLTALGSGIALSDEYTWNGAQWRVTQVNPVEAAGQEYGIQALLKQTKAQRKQIT